MDQITAQLKRQKQEIATGMQQMSRVEDKIQGQRDEQSEEMQKLHEEKAALDAKIKELDNDIQEQAKEHTNAIRNISRRNERRAELVEKCTDAQEVYDREIRLTTKKNAESKRHQYHLKERSKLVEDLAEVDQQNSMLEIICKGYEIEIERVKKQLQEQGVSQEAIESAKTSPREGMVALKGKSLLAHEQRRSKHSFINSILGEKNRDY